MAGDDAYTVHTMRDSTFIMTETLNDVLCMQKIEEGKFDLQYLRTAVKALVSTVGKTMRPNLTSKNITLEVDIESTVPEFVLADRFRVEHVLINLLSNAIKFSFRDSVVKIRVGILNPAKPHEITFAVKDHGIGISEKDQKGLFVPYMQIDPNVLQQGKGCGVGLAICREIVVLHGGKIGINSKVRVEGQEDKGDFGSEFYFTIPFEVLPTEEEQPTSPKRTSSSNALFPLSSPPASGAETEVLRMLDPSVPMTAENYPELKDVKVLIVDGGVFIFIVAVTATLYLSFSNRHERIIYRNNRIVVNVINFFYQMWLQIVRC